MATRVGHQFSGKFTPRLYRQACRVEPTMAAVSRMGGQRACYAAGVRLQTGQPARVVGQASFVSASSHRPLASFASLR